MAITNKTDISLSLAVWLLYDEYDYVRGLKKYISVTQLMKPIRQLILPKRMPPELAEVDVGDFVARGLGKAIHDSVEKAWTKGFRKSLELLGYPEAVIDRVRINPTDEELIKTPDCIPVYLEQRLFREFEEFTIGGKFDLVCEGIVQDNKSTSAYSWLHDDKDDDYRLQMSLYRWLDAGQSKSKITADYGQINFIFTDWQKMQAKSNPNYPQKRVEQKSIDLMPLEETELWVRGKLMMLEAYANSPEDQLPECTAKELWQSEPKYKYYADANKTSGKSTKNFDNAADARAHQASKGGVGVVKTVPGEPKRCGYCEVFPICSQKDHYFHD
jgi:hypothetical protein